MAIKEIKKEDYNNLKFFFQRNDVPEITKYFDPFPLNEDTIKKILKDRSNKYYILYINREVRGFGMLRWWQGYENPTIGVLIDYEAQERGLGKKMTKYLVQKSLEHNCKNIFCHIHEKNEKSKKMVIKNGFKKVGEEIKQKEGLSFRKFIFKKENI